MERRVIFQDRMDADHTDMLNLQSFVEQSLDHIVGDGITNQRRYAGFDAAASGVTSLTAQPGRLFVAGEVFNYAGVFVHDFTAELPVATKKIAVLAAWGQVDDTDVRPRSFVIDDTTLNAQAQPVAMEEARAVHLSVALGQENADPLPPLLDAGLTAIATIVLAPTGIVSVTMNAAARLDSVESVSARTASLEKFRDKANPQIASLGADIAALTVGQEALIGRVEFGRVTDRVASLEARMGVAEAAIASFSDLLLDDRGSDPAFPASDAKIEEGVRFGDEVASVTQLQLLDPLNPKAKVLGGVLFPSFTLSERFTNGARTGEVQLAAYAQAVQNYTTRTISRHRVRHGPARTLSTAANWLKTGRFDVSALTFRREDEEWVTPANKREAAIVNARHDRHDNHWEDSYESPYWDEITAAAAVNGALIAETFLQANDMWLGGIMLEPTKLAAAGGITLLVCELDRGRPRLDRTISATTFAREDLALGEIVLPIQPAFLVGGNRYAIVVLGAADHWFATVAGDDYRQGAYFYGQDGAYLQGQGTFHLRFGLHAAQFAGSQVEIEMKSLTLAGGIADIDVLAAAVIPGSTLLTYQIQVGGIWYPLAKVDQSILGAGGVTPDLIPFKISFTGTPDVMPALVIDPSQVRVSRGNAAFTYHSDPRPLPGAGSSEIRATYRLESFDDAHHDLTPKILTGAAFDVEVAATSVTDVVQDDGAVERTAVFSLGAAVTAFRHKLLGTTDSPLLPFHVARIADQAL